MFLGVEKDGTEDRTNTLLNERVRDEKEQQQREKNSEFCFAQIRKKKLKRIV